MSRLAIVIVVALAGCTHRVQVDPIRVEPIHLTLDVRLRVDRELDEFFAFEEELAPPEPPELPEPAEGVSP